jgi:hypothetical protein
METKFSIGDKMLKELFGMEDLLEDLLKHANEPIKIGNAYRTARIYNENNILNIKHESISINGTRHIIHIRYEPYTKYGTDTRYNFIDGYQRLLNNGYPSICEPLDHVSLRSAIDHILWSVKKSNFPY